MKTKFMTVRIVAFLLGMALLLPTNEVQAQNGITTITHWTNGQQTDDPITYCAPDTRTFYVYYQYCTFFSETPCIGGFGANPYRFTITLLRDGDPVATTTAQMSSDWVQRSFSNVNLEGGVYTATVELERRAFPGIWQFVEMRPSSNLVVVNSANVVPNFTVNGNAVPSDGTPVNVCASNINMDARQTFCETRYYIGVQESNRWYTRTFQYEWGRWYQGDAPTSINLQQLSINNSQAPYYTGDPNRQNSALIGGQLPDGQDRYYRVSLCTNEPSWQCKTMLIRVNGNCRTLDPVDVEDQLIVKFDEMEEVSYVPEVVEAMFDDRKVEHSKADLRKDVAATQTTPATVVGMLDVKATPNPFTTQTTVSIQLNKSADLSLQIFDTSGKRVRSLGTRLFEAGETSLTLEREALAPGMYFLHIANQQEVKIQKLMVH
ncbi:MAG: T9SS type A sorting domain-containing protein [Bacteroidota bacterium]